MKFDDLHGKKVVIWGAGREGRAAREELSQRGVDTAVVVTGDGVDPATYDFQVLVGDAAQQHLELADVVVKSPGIPHTSPDYLRLRERGVTVTSLTDLWLNDHHERVIAVTGTKGKSTTSSLIHHILQEIDVAASLVGNGGIPTTTDSSPDAQVAVAEVSSYQAADLTISPRIAVVTSLYPEHLPWHGSFDTYVSDKLRLIAFGPEAVIIPDGDQELSLRIDESAGGQAHVISPGTYGIAVTLSDISWHGIGRVAAESVSLSGLHNLQNAGLALAAVEAFVGLSDDQKLSALQALTTYVPLSHRLEIVPSQDGRVWVDDSLATAPEAVVAALGTYASSNVTLILGGADRGLSFKPLIEYLSAPDVAAAVQVIAVGPVGERFVGEASELGGIVNSAANFGTALELARTRTSEGDVILLSPGAPSFDEFTSYEERSAAFRAAADSSR